ncbi:F-box protein At1g80960-like [Brassica napus]|nr:F-box protein At1g80960-like [Brassica napus]
MERSSSAQVKDVDNISKLPNDVLLLILSRLSTEEAIRTSVVSKRWEHVWKQLSHLVFDIPRIINSTELRDSLNRVDILITKVINNHRGHLESCVINHFPYHGVTGILNTWIQSVTCVKHTKVLTLTNDFLCRNPTNKIFDIPTNSFSHPSLMSLSLSSYILRSSHPLINCSNLKTLKLVLVTAPEVGVFNRVLTSCPSLEVLVLDIVCVDNKSGVPLKIENNTLKVLHVQAMHYIDGIQVSATSLDILIIEDASFGRDGFFLRSPKLQFDRNFWAPGRFVPHMSYNISKEENSTVHEEYMNNIPRPFFRSVAIMAASMSVSVDLRNQTQVERLRQVLRLWTRKMMGLEIIFKQDYNDATTTEENSESWHKKFWKDNINKDAFPSAKFLVKTVWMNNFNGSEEEFAFASCLIRQGTVVDKMMIKTSSLPARKKLEIEAAVVKLEALQTEDERELTIHCF